MLGEFAPVYRACARLGIPPAAVDAMELWEIGAVLGVGEDDAPESPAMTAARLNAERVRAKREGRPFVPPVAPGQTLDPAVAAALRNQIVEQQG